MDSEIFYRDRGRERERERERPSGVYMIPIYDGGQQPGFIVESMKLVQAE